MIWGTFTTLHFITLALAVVLIIGIYYIAKYMRETPRKIFLFILSLSGIAAIIYNLAMWNAPLEYLPLELCSFNAMVLPIVILTKNKVLGNCLSLWSLGALMALVLNNGVANFDIFGWTFFFYYFPHVIEFGLPFILIRFRYIELKPIYILSTLGITAGLYTCVHFVNVGLNKYFLDNNITNYLGEIVTVNYMFSMFQTNPALELFYKIIPYQYWYMYLCLPFIAVYLIILYFIHYLIIKFSKPRVLYI